MTISINASRLWVEHLANIVNQVGWVIFDMLTLRNYVLLASSGPYGPFLAIQRAFYNKIFTTRNVRWQLFGQQISIGKSADVQPYALSFSIFWTEWFRRRYSADFNYDPETNDKSVLLAPRGHPRWGLAYQATPVNLTHQSSTLDPALKAPRARRAAAIRLLVNDYTISAPTSGC